jgi:hypothetical protein
MSSLRRDPAIMLGTSSMELSGVGNMKLDDSKNSRQLSVQETKWTIT